MSNSSSSFDSGAGGEMGGGGGNGYAGQNEMVLTPSIEQQPMEYRHTELTVTQGATGGWFVLGMLAAFTLGMSIMSLIRKAPEAKDDLMLGIDIACKKLSDEAVKEMLEYKKQSEKIEKDFVLANPAYLNDLPKIRVHSPFWLHQMYSGNLAFYAFVAKRIRDAQSVAGKTNAEMAKLMGMPRSSYAAMISGRQKIFVHQIMTVADVLDINPISLLSANHDA